MRALIALLFVCCLWIFGLDVRAADSLFAVGGGAGLFELGGLKAMLHIDPPARLIWQIVIEAPAERRLSARFALGFGSFGSVSLTQLDTLLLLKLGAKIYAGVGSGLMRFSDPNFNLWQLAGYGLIGLKSEVFQNATFFLDLRLIALLPDIGSILAADAIPFQLSFGVTFKL